MSVRGRQFLESYELFYGRQVTSDEQSGEIRVLAATGANQQCLNCAEQAEFVRHDSFA